MEGHDQSKYFNRISPAAIRRIVCMCESGERLSVKEDIYSYIATVTAIQIKGDGLGPGHWWRGEKWSASGHTFKVEPAQLPDD